MAEHNLQNEIVGEGDEVFAIVQRPTEHWIVYNDVAALFNKHFNGTPFNWTCVPFCVSGYQFCRSVHEENTPPRIEQKCSYRSLPGCSTCGSRPPKMKRRRLKKSVRILWWRKIWKWLKEGKLKVQSEKVKSESEADDRDKHPDYNPYQHGLVALANFLLTPHAASVQEHVLIRKVIELHDKYIVYEIGAQCSQFVKRRLCENLLRHGRFREDAAKACNTAFLSTNSQLHVDVVDDSMSWTTAITVMTPFRADELERMKLCGLRVLTLDQIESLKNPDVQLLVILLRRRLGLLLIMRINVVELKPDNPFFQNHTLFHKALKEAFEIFCNKTVAGSSSAELLAALCANILKKMGSEKWGPQLDQATYKNRQHLYLSEQTDGSVPNTLVIANCEVVKPRVAAAEHISQVNRIRELSQNSKIISTHTNSPDVSTPSISLWPKQLEKCRVHASLFSFGLSIYTRMRRTLGLLSVFLMTVRTGGGGTLQWSLAEANLVSKCDKL
ncbi:hypothetical protein F2Q68_00033515 [Brassica cretica]|uniref:Uncharacterized protein n=1 Tax=Brassica cretica TaxID=69181 RepID=A0A8S9H5X8_BRACR|nr:hypothetical protein F2Q68_00033515 [Brassica cretica]